uniref:BACK domain-containing protein n=1 Tax=Glossina brevipalpis TaxID=37001 RepID=A0A1A9W451_9MUSC
MVDQVVDFSPGQNFWSEVVGGQFLKQRMKLTNCFSARRIAELHSCEELFNFCNEYVLGWFRRLIDVEKFLQLSFEEIPLQYYTVCRTVVIENNIYSIEDMQNERMSNSRFDPREGRCYFFIHVENADRFRDRGLYNKVITDPLTQNIIQLETWNNYTLTLKKEIRHETLTDISSLVSSTRIERSKTATALAWENEKLLKLSDRFTPYNNITELMRDQFCCISKIRTGLKLNLHA